MPHFISYYVYVVDMILARVNQNGTDIGMTELQIFCELD